ncbi:MAG: anhydro-N-acetylmuramic acid kinase [Candidatus Marinimicrobia bacterium]|nr:anhydro-N-acetylmuramic acid kinase [Candidatus Neomarinimicrobiota bacterium]
MNKINCSFQVEKPIIRSLGLMTGTSMDGLDICVADIELSPESAAFDIKYSNTVAFPPELKERIQSALNCNTGLISDLHYDLGRWMADTVSAEIPKELIPDIIGCHGQTIFHNHNVSTFQIGEPSFLAESLGVPVISDFRARDISVGGCGAPLIPIIDKWLLQDKNEFRISLNVGGIANVTILPILDGENIIGFDTGPGMALMDEAYINAFSQGIDTNGKKAQAGQVHDDLVYQWVEDSFIQKSPPKSAGRHDYGLDWLKVHNHELETLVIEDQLATLCAFTAESIYKGCVPYIDGKNGSLIIGGGGSHHERLIHELEKRFTTFQIRKSDEFGIPVDGKEALGFAILAVAYVKGIPGNLPQVTGARKATILGKLTI